MMDNSLPHYKKCTYGKCLEQFLNRMVVGPTASYASNQYKLTFCLPELVSEPPEVRPRPDESQILTQIDGIRRSFSSITVFSISKKTLLYIVIIFITNVSPI